MEERLQKVMAHAGVASRRASEKLILAGRVMVNGEIVTELGTKVNPDRDVIVVDGELIAVGAGKVYIKLNKPVGIISTADDEWGRKTVLDIVSLPGRVYPVGRLDADSEGLILLTNDGEVTDRLTHPRFRHEKTYLVLVSGQSNQAALESLVSGVQLDDGPAAAVEVTEVVGVPQSAPGMELKTPAGMFWLEITLTEGRKRQVRRMLEKVGFRVERLIRVRLGPLELGKLKPGESKPLTALERRTLIDALSKPSGRRRLGAKPERTERASAKPRKPQGAGAKPAKSERAGAKQKRTPPRPARSTHSDTRKKGTKRGN
jgi:23S rRNA pseudouridine2605 synthase